MLLELDYKASKVTLLHCKGALKINDEREHMYFIQIQSERLLLDFFVSTFWRKSPV